MRFIILQLAGCLLVAGGLATGPLSVFGEDRQVDEPIFLSGPRGAYPTDPNTDIEWYGGQSSVGDIEGAFNNGRAGENSQLGTAVPTLSLPSQSTWDSYTDPEKCLWLVNRERVDRGLKPLSGVEANVQAVAQYYASYLLANNAWGHYADGQSPWDRLDANPAIHACHDVLNVSENLSVFVSTTTIPLPIERSVYMWMYEDAGSSWGHRHMLLWYPFNENSGSASAEGFMGLGRASGGPYQGPFSTSWPNAELIVMNVFDPCSTWSEPTPTPFPTATSTPTRTPTPTSTPTPTPTPTADSAWLLFQVPAMKPHPTLTR